MLNSTWVGLKSWLFGGEDVLRSGGSASSVGESVEDGKKRGLLLREMAGGKKLGVRFEDVSSGSLLGVTTGGGVGLNVLGRQTASNGEIIDSSVSTAEQKQPAKLLPVKASDYPTPPEILEDPSKIPTYYVFQSNMVTDEDLQPGMLRNLEVDRRLTVPTRTHIRFLITGGDVIHSWAVPSLGIKADAIPGRLQKINCFILREGVFYGQCSELCGALHGFMPIVVEAVSPETYAAHAKKFYKD